MRSAVAGLALAFLASGLSFAADSGGPDWAQAPDRSDWAKAYPAHAAQAGIAGAVQMRCSASEAGALQNCAVVSESPTGQGFGAAALSLASGMELKPTTADGKPVAGRSFIVPVKFDPGVLQGATTITKPDWVGIPSNDALIRYVPSNSAADGGRAVVHCYVTNRGLMDRCSVVNETPVGHGYGGAALALTQLFFMRPMTVDGQPVGGAEINIPIKWEVGGNGQMGVALKVFSSAPWLTAPSIGAMSEAFPKSAIGKVASAHVIMRCAIKDSGVLEGCESISEIPDGQGFGRAAASLVKDFRLPPAKLGDSYSRFRADVPFDFRDPSHAAPPVEIHDPIWLKQLDAKAIPQLFPAAAAKAGYKVGRASVECTVAADGTLSGCATATEDPAGLGFGDAALEVAGVMQMSPWTKQGAPAEGARILLPIKFVLPDTAAPPASPPKQP